MDSKPDIFTTIETKLNAAQRKKEKKIKKENNSIMKSSPDILIKIQFKPVTIFI